MLRENPLLTACLHSAHRPPTRFALPLVERVMKKQCGADLRCAIHERRLWAGSRPDVQVQQSTLRADCGLSPQVRNRKGSSKKADAQGIDQFFLSCKRSEGSCEPKADTARGSDRECHLDKNGPIATLGALCYSVFASQEGIVKCNSFSEQLVS